MDLLNGFAVGHDLTIYNILGPIMLAVLTFGAVLFHKVQNRPINRSASFAPRVRAAVVAGYLSKEEGAEIIAMRRSEP